MRHGFAVMAVPETGLFVKDGRLETGHGTPMVVNKIFVFAKRQDAVIHAVLHEQNWSKKEVEGKPWHFHVVPVQVEEKG